MSRGTQIMLAPVLVMVMGFVFHAWSTAFGLLAGGGVGWIVTRIMRVNGQQGELLGALGWLLGGWLAAVLFGIDGDLNDGVSPAGMLSSLLGSVVLAVVANRIRTRLSTRKVVQAG